MTRVRTLVIFLACLLAFTIADARSGPYMSAGLNPVPTVFKPAAEMSFPYTGLPESFTGYSPGFDSDIKQMRHNIAPGLRYHIDDYTQYLPAAVMVGMKAFGYESRTSWGRMLVSDAFSGVIMAGLVNGLKYTVRTHSLPDIRPPHL